MIRGVNEGKMQRGAVVAYSAAASKMVVKARCADAEAVERELLLHLANPFDRSVDKIMLEPQPKRSLPRWHLGKPRRQGDSSRAVARDVVVRQMELPQARLVDEKTQSARRLVVELVAIQLQDTDEDVYSSQRCDVADGINR